MILVNRRLDLSGQTYTRSLLCELKTAGNVTVSPGEGGNRKYRANGLSCLSGGNEPSGRVWPTTAREPDWPARSIAFNSISGTIPASRNPAGSQSKLRGLENKKLYDRPTKL